MKIPFDKMAQPVDGASLAAFRIMYGFIMAYHVASNYLKGMLVYNYFKPTMEFNYHFAQWVGHLPDSVLTILYGISFICAVCVMLGYRYKITALLFVLIETYFFLSNALDYLNHLYFVIILGFLLWMTPAHKLWSLDAIRNRKKGVWPASDAVPKWAVYLLIIQMEIMLLYAGFVKFTPEFIEGHALREWISNYPLFAYEWQIRVAVLVGTATHMLAAPLLLFRKTRGIGFCFYALFHFSNHIMFKEIAIFPFITLAATTIFLDRSWPRICMGSAKYYWQLLINALVKAKRSTSAVFQTFPPRQDNENKHYVAKPMSTALKTFFIVWCLVQALLPLRHYLIPGYVHWDRNGHLLSWHMMLISRKFGEGSNFYICGEKAGEETKCWEDYKEDSNLPLGLYVEIYMYPDLAIQYAHQLEDRYKKKGYEDIRVYGVVRHSMSGRPYQNYWDPDIDLTKIERSIWKDEFLLPVKYDLPEIPPLKAKIQGRLETDYGYWKELYPPNNMMMYNNFHQRYPKEVFNYYRQQYEKQYRK